MSLLIKKSVFDEYFNLLYKIELDHLKKKEQCYLDYVQMNLIKSDLKKQIREIFESSIKNNYLIQLDKNYHKLCYIDYDDYIENGQIETKWIRTNNKIELYKYLLFNYTDSTCLSECIDYWFSESIGYYPDNSRQKENRLVIDSLININFIDIIGRILKSYVKTMNLTESDKINNIYNYEFNNKNINYIQYKKYIDDLNLNFPKIYDLEYIDLIELFDVFFGINQQKNIYTNSKIYNTMWIESSNNIYI